MGKAVKRVEGMKAGIVIVCAVTLILLRWFLPIHEEGYTNSFFFYFLMPLLLIILLFRQSPKRFGFRLGDWKKGLKYAGMFGAAALVLNLAGMLFPSIRETYGNDYTIAAFGIYLLKYGLAIGAEEFFFRGFMLFGLAERFGRDAIFIQMIPFALLHLGKPGVEAFTTIITGLILGYIALKSKAWWPAWLSHLSIGLTIGIYANWGTLF
ncbi:CPBP family intramembrane metalloprotease [Candidatus Woesearchaeota archaeon]|nr:CPBP family intramembrane metalloprotease [Candidatus Woesearchaeota archaeon]